MEYGDIEWMTAWVIAAVNGILFADADGEIGIEFYSATVAQGLVWG